MLEFVESVPQTTVREVSVAGPKRDCWIGFKNGLSPSALLAGVPETSMGSCPVGAGFRSKGQDHSDRSGA